MSEPRRAVIAAEDGDGGVLYEYGWVDSAVWQSNSDTPSGRAVYTTMVRWLGPPHRAARYPTEADFARALPARPPLSAPDEGGPPFASELVAVTAPHENPSLAGS